MKRVGRPVFFIVVVFIALLTYSAFYGISSTFGDNTTKYIKGAGDIRWGIDIRGGVDVTFSPPDGVDATNEQMKSAESVIKLRLLSQNITDSEVYTDFNRDRIIVRFPWKEDEINFDPEKAIEELGATALLTFREGREVDATGLPTGITKDTIIIEGKDIKSAAPAMGEGNQIVVALELYDSGKQAFADATGRLKGTGTPISIWMDDTLISFPMVNEQISDGKAVITGGFTAEDAESLANKINAGALPFKLQTENFSTISPTMGQGAKDIMILAGVIAFVLVCVVMISVYRLPGVIACIALIAQVTGIIMSITGFLPTIPSFTMTLPGIAGIILSIGMGVDANVITNERIREELKAGKSLDGAINLGFDKGWSAIFDGNITVVFVAVVLMGAFGAPGTTFSNLMSPIFHFFGPATAGTVYSFGYTLLAGIIMNFLCGVLLSRLMLKSASRFKAFRNPALYGSTKRQEPTYNFAGKRKLFYTISGVIMAAAIVCTAIFGVRLDIQFKGGAIITYSHASAVDKNEVASFIQSNLGESVSVQESVNTLTEEINMVVSLTADTSLSVDKQQQLTDALQQQYPDQQFSVVQINNVDPTIGKEFFAKCLVALLVSALLMVIYIAFRFRKIGGWSAGVMCMLALLHDSVVVYATFIICRIPLNDNFIAVVMTIIGYSLNATIVIYDRIRENRMLYGKTLTLAENVSKSVNQSLGRAVMTSVSTISAMGIVCIVGKVMGLDSILSFALPLTMGMISGLYSSVCIAPALYTSWQEYKAKKNGKNPGKNHGTPSPKSI